MIHRGDLENQCWEGVLITLQQIGPVWASSLLTPMSPFGQSDPRISGPDTLSSPVMRSLSMGDI
jgi:hypothetical protein